MVSRIQIAALDENCSAAVDFFKRHLLADLIVGGKLSLPPPASSVVRSPSTKVASRMNPPNLVSTAVSEAGYIPASGEILITEGFLCERWCAAYLLVKSAFQRKIQTDEPLLTLLDRGEVATWSLDCPLPTQDNVPYVLETNRLFPTLISCSILHEIGHSVVAGQNLRGPQLELACDKFAARYLLGKRWGEGSDFGRLAVGVWLCCQCSESLTKEDFVQRKHPNPVERISQFLRNHLRHSAKTQSDSALMLLVTAHVVKLARAYRPDQLDGLKWEQPSLREILYELRDCWKA